MSVLIDILQTLVFLVDAFAIGSFLFWLVKYITESFAKDQSNHGL